MNEQKIREAYVEWCNSKPVVINARSGFKAGYLALLNELVGIGADSPELYRLPDGVTK